MRLLQRYILFDLLRVFTFVLSVATVLLVFVGVFEQVRESGLGPLQILQILPFVVPSLLPFTIPATLLLTVCIVYGRMAGDREIVAAKAAGINVLSLLWPSFFLGAVLSVGALLLTDQVIPWAVANIERIVTLAFEDIFLDMLRERNQIHDREHGISISVVAVDGKRLILPTFRYSPTPGKVVTMQAREATLDFKLDRQEVVLNMEHGYLDLPGEAHVEFERESQVFPLPNMRQQPKARHLSIRHIRGERAGLRRIRRRAAIHRDVETALLLATGAFDRFADRSFLAYKYQILDADDRAQRLQTEIHNRFSMSCSCFFFVLFGSPFAILMSRKQFLTSFLFCFLPIVLVYYPLMMLMLNLSKSASVEPAWAMWVPNALVLIACAPALRGVLKH